jgi:hypothetical protein
MKRLLVILVAAAAFLVVPAGASARQRMGGAPKESAVFGFYAIGVTNHGDVWEGTGNEPSRAVEEKCFSAFESTVNNNWAVVYPTNGTKPQCRATAADGVTIENLEGWTTNGRSMQYWTPTVAFDEDPCGASRGAYKGEPSTPRAVIDDLFGIRCPTERFGNLPGTE